jgi:hypothetical protein
MVLIPLFAVLALYNLYTWQIEGKDNLPSFLSPLGMMFIGLGIVGARRNKSLSYVFLALGVTSVFAGLITVIMNLMN